MQNFFDKLEILDKVIDSNNTSDSNMKSVVGFLEDAKLKEHFFNNLKSDIWIKPLFENGFFKNPLDPIKTEEGISFPFWVESRYLTRVLPVDDKLVDLLIKMVMSFETNNERVHEDIIDIIIGLPKDKILPLLDYELKWIENTSYIYMSLPHKYQELMNHLSKIGHDEYAIKFAKSLLLLLPDPKPLQMGDDEHSFLIPTPQTKFERYNYQEILKDTIPNIFEKNPLNTINFLSGLLNKWIELSRKRKEPNKYYDFSHIWRPQLDSSDEKRTYSISDTLVSTLKELVVEYLNNNPNKIGEINEVFESYKWGIYRRFSMYILRYFPDPGLLKKYLINYNYFTDPLVHNEYAILLKYRFSNLRLTEQNKILEWIEKGPDIHLIKKNYREFKGKAITDVELDDRIISWKRKKLLPVSNSLSEEMKNKYRQYIDSDKTIKDDDILHVRTSKVTWGPTSPYSVHDFKDLTIKQIVKKVKKWKHPKGHMDPSPEGLGRVLSSLVKTRIKDLSKEANLFIDLEPNYIRGFISGLNEYVRNKKDIHWLPVLKLCDWVIKQPYVIKGRDQSSEDWDNYDVNWGWTRKNIADLLGNGLGGNHSEIPFKYRGRIWNLLSELMEDADPTIEREKESLKERWDPFTNSINCTRGETMHSIIQYGLWCKRSIEANRKKLFSFDDAIELSEIFTLHLDHRHEKSFAVQSVYGHWFPWLLLLDEKWTNNHMKKIFPLEKIKHDYWKAAWQGYINFRSPYNNVLKYLNKSYNYAINESIGYGDKDEEYYPENTHENLVKHLLTYYWRGKIKLTARGLIIKFFNIAPQKLRAYAINFAGFSLHDAPGHIEDKFIKPLVILWEWRIKVFKNSDIPNEYIDELANFGAWFGSGKLDNDWSLNQIEFVLEKCERLTNKEWVFKHLSKIVMVNPKKVIQICKLILGLDLKPWEIQSWDDELREIINQIIEKGSSRDKEYAKELIDLLGTLGEFKYRDLWVVLNQ